jgi:hypothetical protein
MRPSIYFYDKPWPKFLESKTVLIYGLHSVNDLPLFTKLLALLFADNTTLLASSPKLPELINYINYELYKIATYFRYNKLALHPPKKQLC